MIIICAIVTVIVVALALGLYFGLKEGEGESESFKYAGKAAVVTNGIECATIGKNILNKHGSVADAAIAVLFCEGVACPQSMGLGGGFVMTMYERQTRSVKSLIARESAPGAATENMYENNPTASSIGGLASGVPGELKGYWELHKQHGKLEWAKLVQPTIDLCRNGHIVSTYLARVLLSNKATIIAEPSLAEIFINLETGEPWKEGDKIKRLKLADTLEVIKVEGEDALYNGSLTDGFLQDIKNFGGIITKDDLLAYRPRWVEPVTVDLSSNRYKLYSTPLPASGNVLGFILKVLDGFIDPQISVKSFHQIIETFKHAYGQRTQLGDIEFIPTIKPVTFSL